MNRVTNILTILSLAVVFFVASAHAQFDEPRVVANIPFEFTVGTLSLPAGEYEFQRAESGFVAALTNATFSVVSGGVGCIVVLAVVAARIPELRAYRTPSRV